MTDADRAMIRETAREIVAEVGPDIAEKAARTVIKEHVDTCPVRSEVDNRLERVELRGQIRIRNIVIAALAGGALSGGGITAVLELLKLAASGGN